MADKPFPVGSALVMLHWLCICSSVVRAPKLRIGWGEEALPAHQLFSLPCGVKGVRVNCLPLSLALLPGPLCFCCRLQLF